MLGYASICQSGLIIGTISNCHIQNEDWIPVEVALTAYALALALAFHVLEILEAPLGGVELHRLAGLWERSPLCAGALSLALLSLAGFPPAVGMLSTYHVLRQDWAHHTYLLMISLGIGQLAVLYGFLNVAKQMFWSAPRTIAKIPLPENSRTWLVVLCVLVIVMGLWPGWDAWGVVKK
jgi:NADH-quinone oxidoreductase subunit N